MDFVQTLKLPFQLLDRRFPDQVQPLVGRRLKVFRLLWVLAFVWGIIGPLGGIYLRLSEPANNSSLFFGSRLGLVLDQSDATTIRFPVGAITRSAGVRAGDELVAIDNLTLPAEMPMSHEVVVARWGDPAYQYVWNLLSGSIERPIKLSIKSASGDSQELTVTPGEKHLDQEGRRLGMPPPLMSLIGILHALFYPVLLWIAYVLHVRNPTQPVAALLSISILLTLGAEQPASSLMAGLVPRVINVFLFDLGNMALIAAILLFPDGRLRPRLILVPISLLPVLFFLEGQAYQLAFLVIFVIALAVFIKRLREATGVTKQQLKFLIVGVAAYFALRLLSILFDLLKLNVGSFGEMLVLEAAAGVAFALSILLLILVLFSALRRHRLYDADALFSRSAMIAALALAVAGFFAVTSALLERAANSVLAEDAGPWPALIAAAAAALLIKPTQRRIHNWAERGFQRGLFELRTELPKRMDDHRETDSPTALLREALEAIVTALRATTATALLDKRPVAFFKLGRQQVRQWLTLVQLDGYGELQCDRSDALLPARLPLRPGNGGASPVGWILLGPRPDGSIYSRDERQALLEIAEPIARAVQVARQRQQVIETDRRWRVRQERRTQDLEERLDLLSAVLSPVTVKPAST